METSEFKQLRRIEFTWLQRYTFRILKKKRKIIFRVKDLVLYAFCIITILGWIPGPITKDTLIIDYLNLFGEFK